MELNLNMRLNLLMYEIGSVSSLTLIVNTFFLYVYTHERGL